MDEIERVEKKLDEHILNSRDTHKEIFKRLNKLEQDNTRRDEQYSNIMYKLEVSSKTIDEIKDSLDSLKLEPAKKYNKIVITIVTSILSALIGYIGGIIL